MSSIRQKCGYTQVSSRKLFFFLCLSGIFLAACTEQRPYSKDVTKPVELKVANSHLNARVISGNPPPVNATFDAVKYENADLIQGALLYDSWFNQFGSDAPIEINPIWNLLGPTTVSITDTWRCSSCHGWDYQGVNGTFGDVSNSFYTGMNGIVPALAQISPQEIWTFILEGSVTDEIGTIAAHNFVNLIMEDDIYAITKFIALVRQEGIDQLSPLVVVDSKASINGNQSIGSKLFNLDKTASCASCHGIDGNGVEGVNVRELTSSNLPKALHRIRFGVANALNPMPGVIVTISPVPETSLSRAGDITAFAAHGINADRVRGGRLYDDWIIESGIDTATLPLNPLWDFAFDPSQIPVGVNTDPIESWRCVNCHTYYYEGGNGFGFNNLLDLKEVRGWIPENGAASYTYIYEFLMKGFPVFLNGAVTLVHNYGQFITLDSAISPGIVETDLWDLADFAVEEVILTDQFLQPDIGTAVGGLGRPADIDIGLEYYTGINSHFGANDINCSQCHGLDGLGIANVDLATMAWDEPWKFLHRTRFGVPRGPGVTLNPPFGNASTVMPGILEWTKHDGVTASDNDDAMHVQSYVQLILNGFTPQ